MSERIVENKDGEKVKIIDRPTGLKDWLIPTGFDILDGKCPNCGEVGFWQYHGSKTWEAICTNDNCRVSKFDMDLKEV